jgi:transcriptional regulator of acetoin/glycerol metabolism
VASVAAGSNGCLKFSNVFVRPGASSVVFRIQSAVWGKHQGEQIRAMHTTGVKPAHIARQLGVARSSVYRMLGAQ